MPEHHVCVPPARRTLLTGTLTPLRRRLAFAALPLAAIVSWTALPVGATTAPTAGTRPYVRLFTQAENCRQAKDVNSLTGAALSARLVQITRWYAHLNNQGANRLMLAECKGSSSTTLASKLTAMGMLVSNYRNGSYVSQSSIGQDEFHEAALLEAAAPRAIGTFWPPDSAPTNRSTGERSSASRLAGALGSTATGVSVTSPAAFRPKGAPSTWPFQSSRGTGLGAGAHSANTHDFVSWIRVDAELMQVVAGPVASGGKVQLRVRRGIWGTKAVAHGAGARVMAPVYIGGSSASSVDTGLSGSPKRDNARVALRYAIKVWQPDGYGWIAGRVKAMFGKGYSGYNAVWLDVTSCVEYNNADATGSPRNGWDDPAGTKLNRDSWGRHQATKLDALRRLLPGLGLIANSLGHSDDCTDNLLAHHVRGGSLENWMHAGDGKLDWAASEAQAIQIERNNWPAMFFVRWDRHPSADQYKRFSYGSLLLALRPTATRPMYGGPFGLTPPDALYFWNFGAPRSSPTSVTQLKVPGTSLYRREFANGVVVVNPSTHSASLRIASGYFDVSARAGGPRALGSSLTVEPGDAAFLVR